MPDALTTPAAQASPATTVPPPLGPPRDPATAGAAPGGRRFRPGALAVALLVLLAGAAAGGVMFALEQSHLTWRPHATSTASGWRIAAPHGQRVQYAALSGGHLVWVCGAYTGVFDLASGRSRLLGIARRAGAGGPVAVSREYAAWLDESSGDATGPSSAIWTYRFTTSRRHRLAGTQYVGWAPALSGATLAWAHSAGGSATSVTARDLSHGVDRVAARGASVDGPVTMDGARVGWFVRAASPLYDVKDLADGQLSSVDLEMRAGGAWADLMDIDLSGTTMVWRLQSANGSGEILMHDLAGGTTQPVASGPGLSGGSIDGGRVVWAQPGTGGGTSIMCRRLSDATPFVVATVATGRVSDVLVSGDTVAWVVEGGTGGFNGIETGRLAQ